jgi:hypothetical protein
MYIFMYIYSHSIYLNPLLQQQFLESLEHFQVRSRGNIIISTVRKEIINFIYMKTSVMHTHLPSSARYLALKALADS